MGNCTRCIQRVGIKILDMEYAQVFFRFVWISKKILQEAQIPAWSVKIYNMGSSKKPMHL